jgi:hypothetical protein
MPSLFPGEPSTADMARAAALLEAAWAAPGAPARARAVYCVYWSPADRAAPADAAARLGRVTAHIAAFYARELARHGLPVRRLAFEADAAGGLRLHLATGRRALADVRGDYSPFGEEIADDARAALARAGVDAAAETVLIFCNLARWDPAARSVASSSPYYASFFGASGMAWQLDTPILDAAALGDRGSPVEDGQWGRLSLGAYNSLFVGGVAHELGHALGLGHVRAGAALAAARGTPLMGTGNRTYAEEERGEGRGSFLTRGGALRIAAHPLFARAARPLGRASDAAFSELAFEDAPEGLRVTGRVRGSAPVHAVIATACPDGAEQFNLDDEAAAVPRADGAFTLLLPHPEGHAAGGAAVTLVAVDVGGATTDSRVVRAAISAAGRLSAAPAAAPPARGGLRGPWVAGGGATVPVAATALLANGERVFLAADDGFTKAVSESGECRYTRLAFHASEWEAYESAPAGSYVHVA